VTRKRPSLRFLFLSGGVALFLWLGLWFVPVPKILALRSGPPATTAFIRARQAKLRKEGKSDVIDRRPVPLSAVSPAIVEAVVAAEDSRFYSHRGIDWQAVAEAREWNRKIEGKKGRWRRGASTLTQQLAKNLWLSPERSWWRKGREAACALALEALLPKQKILEHYLSAIEFGERVFGVEAASRTYFGIPAAKANRAQAAWLAAMIPSPSYYLRHPARHAERAALIERRVAGPGGAEPPPEADEEPESAR
jgi:monofunctional biosynthetic peptidoglycan transglycosylase